VSKKINAYAQVDKCDDELPEVACDAFGLKGMDDLGHATENEKPPDNQNNAEGSRKWQSNRKQTNHDY
jgi:hypothetical protein